MIPQRPGRQTQSGRYTSKVIKKLAEDDTQVVLGKVQKKKDVIQTAGKTVTGQKPSPILMDPEKGIQGQTQFS